MNRRLLGVTALLAAAVLIGIDASDQRLTAPTPADASAGQDATAPGPDAPTPPSIDTPLPSSPAYRGPLADEGLRRPETRSPHSRGGATVRIEVIHRGGDAARDAAVAAGATDIRLATDTLFEATLPVDALVEFQSSPAVVYLREPVGMDALPEQQADASVAPMGYSGKYGSDLASKAKVASWHTRGYKGTGVKIGIIDAFDRNTWAKAQKAKEVPAISGEFCRSSGTACNAMPFTDPNSHGVAVAEAIHDMAPAAKFYLGLATTAADYRDLIDYFKSKGVKIISRSLGAKYDGPGDGTGDGAWLVDYAASKGIAWFNSAGNSGAYRTSQTEPLTGKKRWAGGYWRGPWRDTDADGWLEFTNVDGLTSELMVGQCRYIMGLRWNDWGANATDYDAYLFEEDPWGDLVQIGTSQHRQTNGYAPLELNQLNEGCPYSGYYYYIAIRKFADGNGTAGDILELMENGAYFDFTTSPYSAAGAFVDSANPGMASIGAVDPVAGKVIAPYSSWGPTNDGRLKPDFSAGSNFTSWAGYQHRFNGTSAATPAASGMAALILQRYPSYTPAQLMTHLKTYHMVDRGVTGPDTTYGNGELILDGLFTTLPAPKITGTVKEGSTLKITKGTWKPTPSSYSYQWYRESTAISGATKSSYKLTASDAGKRIKVKVTAKKANYLSDAKTSAFTKKVVALKKFSKAPVPKITGTKKVGSTLKATAGTWAPVPTLKYQWRRDGAAISGATKSSYKLVKADAGKKMTVTVTASKSGYRTASKTSTATGVVSGGTGCTGQIANGGFESGTASWTTIPGGIILSDATKARTGAGYARLGGHGATATDVLSTTIAIPAGCKATLTYYLAISTSEGAAAPIRDTITARVGDTVVQTYSNQDAADGYLVRSVDLGAYAGSTVTVSWTAVENASAITTFLIDDVTAAIAAL